MHSPHPRIRAFLGTALVCLTVAACGQTVPTPPPVAATPKPTPTPTPVPTAAPCVPVAAPSGKPLVPTTTVPGSVLITLADLPPGYAKIPYRSPVIDRDYALHSGYFTSAAVADGFVGGQRFSYGVPGAPSTDQSKFEGEAVIFKDERSASVAFCDHLQLTQFSLTTTFDGLDQLGQQRIAYAYGYADPPVIDILWRDRNVMLETLSSAGPQDALAHALLEDGRLPG